jgi:hypothetical protein
MTQPMMQHPVFGSLEYGEDSPHWKCEMPVPVCLSRAGGQEVFYLSIYAKDREAPHAEAVKLWLELANRAPSFSEFLEQAIFAAYQQDLPHYRSLGEVPDVTRADQVWQYVGLHEGVIKPRAEGGLQLVVALTAKWRREFGMDLVFRAGQLGVGEGFMPWNEMIHVELPE